MKVNIGSRGISMAQLAKMCGGMLCCIGGESDTEILFESVCTDSRESSNGALFIALGGERVDGHDYIDAALSAGGGCVLCERIPEQISERRCAAVVVEDSIKAIGEFAKAYDRSINHKKVAITGSVGKTTTKEFVACVLSEKYRVHKTEGNYNSNIGLPLSILSMKDDTEVSVLEMGMSGLGEIEYLSRLAEPDIALITTIGSSHIGHLGSRENICRAKLEIVSGLKSGGTLIVNGDEPLLADYKKDGINVLRVAINNESAEYRALNIRYENGYTVFDIATPLSMIMGVKIPVLGDHNVMAALFAYAVGERSGLDSALIAKGLCNFRQVGMRQNIYDIGSIRVIEDCYNASPESMKAAFAVQRSLASENEGSRMVALLGDMYELVNESGRYHEQVGADYANAGGELLFTFGNEAEGIATGSILHGMLPEKVYRNPDVKNPSLSGEMLIHALRPGDVLLVKASRGAAAERVIAYLKENVDRLSK